MSNTESIVDKIKKLLDKAYSTDSLPERDAFILKAQKMLAEHNIDIETVQNYSKTSIIEKSLNINETWSNVLINGICNNNFCKAVNVGNNNIHVMGKIHNVDIVLYLFSFYRHTLLNLSLNSYNNDLKEKEEKFKSAGITGIDLKKLNLNSFKNNYIKDYLMGGISGVLKKLSDAKEKMYSENSSFKEVLIINDTDLRNYVEEKYPFLTGGKARRKKLGDSYYKGYNDGLNINEHKPLKMNIVKTIKTLLNKDKDFSYSEIIELEAISIRRKIISCCRVNDLYEIFDLIQDFKDSAESNNVQVSAWYNSLIIDFANKQNQLTK